ncbi:MAG TPA: anthranilate synthase component I family protein [Ferruginibacter sp.]|nr:anthranilate synthase component I family protein [Ferruginibacter sp.]
MKHSISFPVTDFQTCKIKMLNWVNRFSIFCFLDNRQYDFSEPAFECLLAAGAVKMLAADAGTAFDQLRQFYEANKGEWLFGHLGYDLKNETEALQSRHPDRSGFRDLAFFIPEYVIRLEEEKINLYGQGNLEDIYRQIDESPATLSETNDAALPVIHHRISDHDYLAAVSALRQHILRGDCYEINFCQEFYAEDVRIDPLVVFDKLAAISPNPFSAYYRFNDQYCVCASPERYLQKKGNRICSQPIKGTSRRQLANAIADDTAKRYLAESAKEKSENVMVVDLVRNDLSRVCRPGSVTVDELFGIYSFPQVHQMISTVSGELAEGYDWIDCIKATFPMGSMTGAPKKKVMELIDSYEQSRRGLFSGSIGYVNPSGDFDFNVVIRSLFYNAATRYLSFQTGGGITYNSKPEDEYAESLLKGEAMMQILST